MSMITISDLTFSYDGNYDTIYKQVSFQMDTDWRLGFTGRNGRGKTTFLKLLAGEYEYSGKISKSVEVDYFPFQVADASLPAIDIIGERIAGFAYWELIRELSRLKVDEEVLYRPFAGLSKGEQTKVMLAVLFLSENHFMLIDEPTNHLDAEGSTLVGDYLNSKKGFILVSHDRELLDRCVDHILNINKTSIEIQKGNFSSWYLNKQLQDQYERAENERLKKEITRLNQSAARTAGWSDQIEKGKYGAGPVDRGYVGHKSAKMMKRAKAIELRRQAAAEEKSGLLKNVETTCNLQLRPLTFHSDKLVSLKGVSLSYGDKTVCSGVAFDICMGDRIAVQGKNGSGKSSALKLIAGESISFTGDFKVAGGLVISYVAQDTSGLKGSLKEYARHFGIEESLFMAILRKLDFDRVQFDKDMADFSDGQKKKALLARSLCEKAHLYIWDEPLNFIDVFSRMQIEALIAEFHPTLLFVEHDRAFVSQVATKNIFI